MENQNSGEQSNTPRQSNRGNWWSGFVAYPAKQMECWPVGKAVGNVKNDSPDLIEPLEA